jgi:adenylate cyclase
MPPEVSQQLLDDPHTNAQSSQQATVLFTDLLGFTPWTQELNDDDILDLLNEALNGAVKTVTSAGGVLDQYVGDAVLGIFNVIADAPDHAFQAIYAAWQFIQVMQKVDAFEFSIGISTDRAAVGVIDNDDQASYTAVGPAVSQAKQLQEIAQAHQIVISATTYALVQDRVDVQLAGSHLLAGRKLSGDVYVVTAIRP